MLMSKSSLMSCIFLVLISASAWAQFDPCNPSVPPITQRGRSRPPDPESQQRDEMRRTQEKKANEERQSSLKKDSEELLKLATELKQSVDQTTVHTLSVEVIRKAQEIEKLAKNVREKMKGNQYCDLLGP